MPFVELGDGPVVPLEGHGHQAAAVFEDEAAVGAEVVGLEVGGFLDVAQECLLVPDQLRLLGQVGDSLIVGEVAEEEDPQQHLVASYPAGLGLGQPADQFGAAGPGDGVFLAAARPSLAEADQAGVAQVPEFPVDLALGGWPDVGEGSAEFGVTGTCV